MAEYRQEMLEMFWEPTQPRLDEGNLHPISYAHDPMMEEVFAAHIVDGEEVVKPVQVDTTILPRFEDGSVLGSLYVYGAQRKDKNLHFRSRKIDRQLGFLDKDAYEKFTKKKKLKTDPFDKDTLKKMRDQFPVMKLDNTLIEHHIQRSRSFESKVKYYDVEVRMAKHTLEENGELNFPKDKVYQKAITEAGPIFERAVTKKKGARTEMLLDDFRQQLANLDGIEVWMLARIHRDEYGQAIGEHATDLMAVQLVGFSIHGEEEEATIEPVVRGVDGQEGLLPESVYVDPGIYLRIQPDMVRERTGILAAIKHTVVSS